MTHPRKRSKLQGMAEAKEGIVVLTEHEAALIQWAIGGHAARNGGLNGDETHDDMIRACQSVVAKLEAVFGVPVFLG